jgi:hypothetical protein
VGYSDASERPGTYDVTIAKPGYVTAVYRNLMVTAGLCHVSG